jgi:hypothetical protein
MRPACSAFLASSLLVCLASPAGAQTPEPASTPTEAPAPPSPPQTGDVAAAQWKHDYAVARERLLAGDFADAAARFDALRAGAPTPEDRRLVEELGDLARSYATRGLALVSRNDLGESNLPARAVNERTTDEIAQLYIDSVLYGIGTGGWLAAHTQPSTAAGVVLPMLLFSGAAAGTVALLDVGHPLHYGVAQSTVSGLYLGLEEGVAISLWNQSNKDSSAHWSGTTVADVVWGFSTAGALGGGLLGTTLGTTPGRASFVGSTGLWTGVVAGLASAALTGNDDARGPNAWLAATIGLNAGIVGGLLASGPVSPSIARVRFLDLGGISGGLVAGGLYLAAANQSADARAGAGITALGIAAGLGVAWVATSGIPADRPEDRQKKDAITFEPTLAPVPGGATVGVYGTL